MSLSTYYLNQRIANLQSEVTAITSGGGGGVPTSSDLAVVLTNGNIADNSIVLTDGITTNTIDKNGMSGNAASATTATNLAGGVASQIPYQSSAGTTAFIANGTSGQYLKSNGTATPSWATSADLSIPTGVLQGTATTYNGSTAVTISAKPPFAFYSDLGTFPSPIIAPATTYAFDFLGSDAFNGMPFIITRAKFCLLPQTGYYKVTARVNLGQSTFVAAGVNSLFLQVQINGVNSMAENYGSLTPFNGFGAFPATCYFQLVCDTIVSVSAVDGTNNKLSCLITNSATGNSTIQYQMISIHKISDL